MQQSSWECHSEKCYYMFIRNSEEEGCANESSFVTFVILNMHNCLMRSDSVSRLHYSDSVVPTAALSLNHQNKQEIQI